jgi:hypothetical protein
MPMRANSIFHSVENGEGKFGCSGFEECALNPHWSGGGMAF